MGVVISMTHAEWESCHDEFRLIVGGQKHVITPAKDGTMHLARVRIVREEWEPWDKWRSRRR